MTSSEIVAFDRLKHAQLRPTRQRMALAALMFEDGDRHFTAEQIFAEAQAADIQVSLATVYNTLHQFTEAGLLREVVMAPGRSYFDTNTEEHHHFYYEDTGELCDIPGPAVTLACCPAPPDGAEITRIEVIIRVGTKS
ncbi:MAG TPA: Fur family transcriptional regulator [Stellaceae bacterium]|nr:Fur family transcriptional regulator [Stellaceae bacterium]